MFFPGCGGFLRSGKEGNVAPVGPGLVVPFEVSFSLPEVVPINNRSERPINVGYHNVNPDFFFFLLVFTPFATGPSDGVAQYLLWAVNGLCVRILNYSVGHAGNTGSSGVRETKPGLSGMYSHIS